MSDNTFGKRFTTPFHKKTDVLEFEVDVFFLFSCDN